MPHSATKFRETNLYASAIRDLGLEIEQTPLAPLIAAFAEELANCGITRLKPHFYLTTEWGVPFGSVTIGIPFYLARPDLTELHAQEVGHIEGAGPSDIMRYLRHEMGHVVNYAYKLYDAEDWVKIFGSITQPYVEEYRPQPFSRRYVRHLPGWYAQKHPDEDWAETFAVWMTPQRDWRKAYAQWPTALAKLQYCDRLMTELRDREPLVTATDLDEQVSDLTYSVRDYYKLYEVADEPAPGLDGDLRAIFDELSDHPEQVAAGETRSAAELIRRVERAVMADVFRWTGHFPERTRSLMRYLARRAGDLEQVYPHASESSAIVAVTVLVTSLAMNHVHRGSYFPESPEKSTPRPSTPDESEK